MTASTTPCSAQAVTTTRHGVGGCCIGATGAAPRTAATPSPRPPLEARMRSPQPWGSSSGAPSRPQGRAAVAAAAHRASSGPHTPPPTEGREGPPLPPLTHLPRASTQKRRRRWRGPRRAVKRPTQRDHAAEAAAPLCRAPPQKYSIPPLPTHRPETVPPRPEPLPSMVAVEACDMDGLVSSRPLGHVDVTQWRQRRPRWSPSHGGGGGGPTPAARQAAAPPSSRRRPCAAARGREEDVRPARHAHSRTPPGTIHWVTRGLTTLASARI